MAFHTYHDNSLFKNMLMLTGVTSTHTADNNIIAENTVPPPPPPLNPTAMQISHVPATFLTSMSSHMGEQPVPMSLIAAFKSNPQMRRYLCQRCLNHNEYWTRRGHKEFCRRKTCTCEHCAMVDNRRLLNNAINKQQATQDIEASSDDESIVDQRCRQHHITAKKREPKCQKCLSHGIKISLRGHKNKCKYVDCMCDRCSLVGMRRKLMAKQIKVRRQQRNDFQRRSYNTLISSGMNSANAIALYPVPTLPVSLRKPSQESSQSENQNLSMLPSTSTVTSVQSTSKETVSDQSTSPSLTNNAERRTIYAQIEELERAIEYEKNKNKALTARLVQKCHLRYNQMKMDFKKLRENNEHLELMLNGHAASNEEERVQQMQMMEIDHRHHAYILARKHQLQQQMNSASICQYQNCCQSTLNTLKQRT